MKLFLITSSILSLVCVSIASPLYTSVKTVGVWKYDCDAKAVSVIPWNVFRTVARSFCQKANKSPGVFELTLDTISATKLKVDKRTPPPNLPAYLDYQATLRRNGSPDAESEGCAKAYDLLQTSECGHAGGQSNNMLVSGWALAGNVNYTYEIGEKST